MSFIRVASRYKPLALWMLDDTTPLQDYSPYNRTATTAGTVTRHQGLIKGATYAPIFTTAVTADFGLGASTPVFIQGKEKNPFSLVVTVAPSLVTANQKILSHYGTDYDGLTINGTVVSFSTKYLTAGEAKCSYDLETYRAVQLVGVHTPTKNSLYVNGVLVSEVDLTAAQQADLYTASASASLAMGAGGGTGKIPANGVAVFNYALTTTAIAEIFNESRDVPDAPGVAAQFGGQHIPLSKDFAPKFLNEVWDKDENWYSAELRNVRVQDNKLIPAFQGTTSVAGQWLDSIPLTTDVTSINGVMLDWDGKGITVETSLDGTTWTAAVRGIRLSNIAAGYNPTGKDLFIRISFAGGVVEDTAYVSRLQAIGLKTGTTLTQGERIITANAGSPLRTKKAIEFDENWGIHNPNSPFTIGPDASELPSNVRSVEMWIKQVGATAPTFFGFSGTTNYINGVASAATLPAEGEWRLIHIVSPTNLTANFGMQGPGSVIIGSVTLYEAALTATQVADISKAYTKSNILVVDDVSALTITQSANAADIYAHTWAIVGAG